MVCRSPVATRLRLDSRFRAGLRVSIPSVHAARPARCRAPRRTPRGPDRAGARPPGPGAWIDLRGTDRVGFGNGIEAGARVLRGEAAGSFAVEGGRGRPGGAARGG